MKESMRGFDFSVRGTVGTPNGNYAVLVDAETTRYFPVQCSQFHSQLVDAIMADNIPFEIGSLGIYFSLISLFRAHDMVPSQAIMIVGRSGKADCSLEIVEENELGMKVSRVPILLADCIMLSVLCKIPIVVYGPAGTDFTFKINKAIPKEGVFSFICEELARAERLSAIGSGSGDE